MSGHRRDDIVSSSPSGAKKRRKIAVFGATGVQGGAAVPVLKEQGHEIIAFGRDKAKLALFEDQGIAARQLVDFSLEALMAALDGADAAFVTLAFAAGGRDISMSEAARQIGQAFQEVGIAEAVWTTSWLTTNPGRSVSPAFDSLRAFTDVVLAGPTRSTVLKPAGYLDNLLTVGSAAAIASGVLPYMLPDDFDYRWISCNDQARYAAALFDRDALPTGEFSLGLQANGKQLADAATAGLGWHVTYEAVSPAAFADQWRPQLGAAADAIAEDYLNIVSHRRNLDLDEDSHTIESLTGIEDRPLKEFFSQNASAFRQL